MVTLMNNNPSSSKFLGVGEGSASLLKSLSSLNTFQSIMVPYADKSEGKMDTELAEENRYMDIERERFEDDERWKRLARHMEYHRNLLRLGSRPG